MSVPAPVRVKKAGMPAPPASQRALRIELDFQFAAEILLGEQLVLPDVRGDHLLDLLGLEQQA